MILIKNGSTLNGANPLLDFWAAIDGKLVDLESLTYTIWNVGLPDGDAQVYPVSGSATVDVDTTYPDAGGGRLSQGHYFAAWVIPGNSNNGRYEVRWAYRFTAGGTVHEAVTKFEIVKGPVPLPRLLSGLLDLREEGFGARYTDERLLLAIRSATSKIERITERRFFPERRVLTVDGSDSHVLMLMEPIIAIESVKIAWGGSGDFTDATTLDPASYRVYSRHVSQGLLTPNDLGNPKIEIVQMQDPHWVSMDGSPSPGWWDCMRFPRGSQNVQIVGVFGATEYDGTPTGQTPAEIEWCCRQLAMAFLPKMADTSSGGGGSGGAGPVSPVIREKTRDQEIEYGDVPASAVRAGMLTGNPNVDDVLLSWRRPPYFGAV